MNSEVSAGGIIVSLSRGGWDVLLMKDMKGNWTFPKGKKETGETLAATARREIEEEVGITNLELMSELKPTMYWYLRGTSIKKTVHYFLFRSSRRPTPKVQTEEGISEAKWFPWATAQTAVGYPKTNAPLLTEAYKKLMKYRRADALQ